MIVNKNRYEEAYKELTSIVFEILHLDICDDSYIRRDLTELSRDISYLESDSSYLAKSPRVMTTCQGLLKLVRESGKDAKAIYDNDPAANSIEEVILCYPGYKAILYHRIAHEFYKIGIKVFARYISEKIHSETGIDIHPGAEIGSGFAIDHGTGIVIGETTVIGKNVTIYQGVTLGAIHLENREQVGEKRHPTIEDNVVIYANATILGGETVIGKGSIIGANTFITKSVEKFSKIYFERGNK